MTVGWREGLQPGNLTAGDPHPFWQGENLREPIFYGGEFAFGFQYRDLAVLKYAKDDEWLKINKHFTLRTVTRIAKALSDIHVEKVAQTTHFLRNLDLVIKQGFPPSRSLRKKSQCVLGSPLKR